MSSRGPRLLPALAVAVLAVAPFFHGALTNRWAFDDYRFIQRNPRVVAPTGWLDFFTDPRTTDPDSPTGIVRPLRTLEFALDHMLFGNDAQAFHLHSLAWHVLAAVLLYLLLRRLLDDWRPAVAGAAFWAVHPVQVESVAWISSRGDVAMGACVLGSLLAALRSRGTDLWLATSVGLGLVAMLYKETAVVLPLLVFAVRLVRPVRGEPGGLKHALAGSWPWILATCAYLVYRQRVMIGGYDHVVTHRLGGGTAGTFATMFRGFGFYALVPWMPARTSLDWYLGVSTTLVDFAALAWAAFHGTVIAAAVAWRRRWPVVACAVGLFYIPLIPVANWPFQIGIPTAERFLYLPLAGAALLVASAARRRGIRPAVALAVACLGILSVQRTRSWYDDDTLWGEVTALHESPRGLRWAAAEALRDAKTARIRGNEEEARRLFTYARDKALQCAALWRRIEHVERSTSHVAAEPEILAANAALSLGDHAAALRHAEEAIRIHESGWPQPHYTRALALLQFGRGAAALRAMRRARDLGFTAAEPEFVQIFTRAEALCLEEGFTQLAAEANREALAVGAPGPLTEAARARAPQYEGRARDLPPEDSVEGIRLRHEGLGTPAGWREARRRYESLDRQDGVVTFRIARCDEELGDDEAALRGFRAALGSADGLSARDLEHARRAVERLSR